MNGWNFPEELMRAGLEGLPPSDHPALERDALNLRRMAHRVSGQVSTSHEPSNIFRLSRAVR